MLYSIIYTAENGNTRNTLMTALNAKQAHEHAQPQDGETVKAYPLTVDSDGSINAYAIMRGAIQVARKCAGKAVENGGTETQYTILNELKSVNARAGSDGAEKLGISYLLDIQARLTADSQDLIGQAYSGIMEAIANGANIEEQYKEAYRAVNAYILKRRSMTQRESSIEYLEEVGGTVVSINTYIARILNADEKYTPIETADISPETVAKLGHTLAEASKALTDRQRDIIKRLTVGQSQRDIMRAMNIKSVATINEHLVRVRKIYADYFSENAPELLQFIDRAKVETSKAKSNRHTAEYYREYRARKRAEAND